MNVRLHPSLLVLALIGLLIAACSNSSATPTPTPAAPTAPPASPSPSASQAASESPSAGESAGPSIALPSFSLPSNAKDLEAVLPSTINGTTLQKASFQGADFLAGAGANAKQFTDFLGLMGKSPSDVSFAIAFDPTGKVDVTMGALKINGADTGRLTSVFVDAAKKSQPTTQTSQTNVGGKSVTKLTDSTSSSSEYVYAKGDVLFFVEAKDDTSAAQGLSALP